MATRCSILVSSLDGVSSALSKSGMPLSVCVHLQEKGLHFDKAMWTARQSSSGFSVSFFWSTPPDELARPNIKKKRKKKKSKVAQNGDQPELPTLGLTSPQSCLDSTKTPNKAHLKNLKSSEQSPGSGDESDDLESVGSGEIDLVNCDVVRFDVKEGVPGVTFTENAGIDDEQWTPVVRRRHKKKNSNVSEEGLNVSGAREVRYEAADNVPELYVRRGCTNRNVERIPIKTPIATRTRSSYSL